MKVWNVKTNDCVTTLDGHDDKVWALTVRKRKSVALHRNSEMYSGDLQEIDDEDVLASGGADSKIVIWKDVTQVVEEEKAKDEAEKVEK